MFKATPPMGWNSWNTFGEDINEEVIMQMADVMVEKGFLDKGYEYLVIDDCYALRERGEDGRIVPDPVKFPHGMKYVADYVHSKGLKFGMYSCAGTLTCAGYPSSYNHEFVDAATFAEWGVDFLKYDYCYHTPIVHGKYLYRRMAAALNNCGREILFSACSWGSDKTHEWIKETGASMWRSTGDINDSWASVRKLLRQQEDILPYTGVGCFNDMDMLIVGMYGKGNVAVSGCTDTQYKSHFSMWALFGSPLMMGCDLRSISDEAYKILTNEELIKINQDPACRQLVKLNAWEESNEWNRADDKAVYYRALADGDFAIGLFNLGAEKNRLQFFTEELGLPESTGKTLKLTEVWTGEEKVVTNGVYITEIEPYDCKVFRASVIDK